MKKIHYLLIIIFFLFSCGSDKAWEKAMEDNTLESYELYISENPKKEHVKDAKILIASIKQDVKKDNVAWQIAKEKNTEKAYKKYLEKFRGKSRSGIYTDSAKMLIKSIGNAKMADDDLWKKTTQTGTYEAYTNYLTLLPKGKHQNEAIDAREKEFVKLLDTDFARIKEFFAIAKQALKGKEYDTLLIYFSDKTCKIDDFEIKGGINRENLISGNTDYFEQIKNAGHFYDFLLMFC